MVYELKNGRVFYITLDELRDDYVMYHIPEWTIEECENNPANFRSASYVQSDLIFFVLDLLDFLNVSGEKQRIGVYLQKERCIFVAVRDENEQAKTRFLRICDYCDRISGSSRQSVPENFLYYFLNDLIKQDKKVLENIEFHMSELESRMMKEGLDTIFINEILSMKKELMYIRNYYEQLIDIAEVLKDNVTYELPEESAKLFGIFVQHTNRLCETVNYLKEYTVQLRETHDAMLDYNLNNIMKLFTVITTVFLPLSLIVGWYGMNFENMPELHWRYGYLGIVLLSLLIVGGCLVIFKKYKLL